MPYIDTHCHMDDILARTGHGSFAGFAELLPADFEACISIACDPEALAPTMALLSEPRIYGAFSLHPNQAELWTPALGQELARANGHPKAVAWGEIGLDYHYGADRKTEQRDAFLAQIRLALDLRKPLVIHTREAEDDTAAILEAEVPADWPVHVHCFTGTVPFAERLLSCFPRLRLGFTGIVTFKNASELQAVARITPWDRFLLETDGPYLAPVPHRGQVAHPGHIPLIAAKLADLKGADIGEVYARARGNTRDMYGI